MTGNILLPKRAVVQEIFDETADTKTFTFNFVDPEAYFEYKPAQFVEISILGVGEAPISITSPPSRKGYLELCIKRVGQVTEEIHKLKIGDEVGIRGPYGNGFPAEQFTGFDMLFVAGGIGLAPLRSLINYVLDNRKDYGKVKILYGARTPGDIIFARELERWPHEPDTEVMFTVDRGEPGWAGNVGLVTKLIPQLDMTPQTYAAFICGPPVMIPFVIKDLLKIGFKEENVVSTLENYMKCGVGKCGHCLLGGKYLCMEGPVFRYSEMKELGFGE